MIFIMKVNENPDSFLNCKNGFQRWPFYPQKFLNWSLIRLGRRHVVAFCWGFNGVWSLRIDVNWSFQSQTKNSSRTVPNPSIKKWKKWKEKRCQNHFQKASRTFYEIPFPEGGEKIQKNPLGDIQESKNPIGDSGNPFSWRGGQDNGAVTRIMAQEEEEVRIREPGSPTWSW